MAVEVYKSPVVWSGYPFPTTYRSLIYQFARAISLSSSWGIVDSHGGAGGARYVGDPIADLQWIGSQNNNSWFIAEQLNPRSGYPPIQFKVQSCDTAAYADASGVGAGYKWEATLNFQSMTLRMCSVGGWDFAPANPDFADPTKASDNRRFIWFHLGSGNDGAWYWVMDDDFVLGLGFEYGNKFYFNNFVFLIEQYNPKSAVQDTVTSPAYLIASNDSANGWAQPYDVGNNSFLCEIKRSDQIVGLLDETGVFQDWGYTSTTLSDFLTGDTQPNEFDPIIGVDLFEIVIRGWSAGIPGGPDDRILGSFKHIWRSFCPGVGMMIDNRNYMSLASQFGMIVPWDGSSDL